MKFLVTSDLHLTDYDIDSYRWGLFPWLKEQVVQHDVNAILILGDITDAKDKHSARLTNRIVESITSLTDSAIEQVICLRGNHDYLDQQTPFFKFLNQIPKLRFVIQPTFTTLGSLRIALLPNARDPVTEWHDLIHSAAWKQQDFIFMHQTVGGSISESGRELEGLSQSVFDGLEGKVISGDVHVPQRAGNVIYVGSPYHVHFGDHFQPRVLLVDGKIGTNLYYHTVQRHTLDIHNATDLDGLTFPTNDQVKIRITLEDVLEWDKIKAGVLEKCKTKGLIVHECKLQKAVNPSDQKYIAEQERLAKLDRVQIVRLYFDYAKVKEELRSYGQLIVEGNIHANPPNRAFTVETQNTIYSFGKADDAGMREAFSATKPLPFSKCFVGDIEVGRAMLLFWGDSRLKLRITSDVQQIKLVPEH